MPKFFEYLGYWVGRFSQEEQRPHVHIIKFGSGAEMKVWLSPEVEIAYVHGIGSAEARKILNEIRRRKNECLDKWNAVHGGND